MANDNEANLNLGINIDADKALGSLGQVRGLTEQVKKDSEAWESSIESLNEKTQKLKGYWTDILEIIKEARSAAEILGTVQTANQTSLSTTMQMVNEILQGVKGLGGNINQAMQMVGMAGGGGMGGIGGYGYGQGQYFNQTQGRFTPDITSSVDFSKEGVGLGGGGYVKRSGFFGRRRGGGGTAGSAGGIGGGGIPPTAGTTGPEDEDFGDIGAINTEDFGIYGSEFRTVAPRPAQVEILDQLQQRYPKAYQRISGALTPGRESLAARYMYNDMMNTVNRVSRNLPLGLGKAVKGIVQNSLASNNINSRTIMGAISQHTTPIVNASGDTIGYTRNEGIPLGGIEDKVGKLAETVTSIFGNKLIGAFTSFAGYATIAGTVAENVAGAARQLTGYAQSQGSVFGETDFSRTAGLTLGALVKSDFGLNPNFSAQQVMQNQMLGASLGLKGSALNNYVNTALNFQTQYGLNAQQTQALLGGGLGVGVDVGTNALGISAVRAIENATNISTTYGNQAYMQGLTAAAGMGVSKDASKYFGVIAADFPTSGGNFGTGVPGISEGNLSQIAQTAKLTGQELMGTTLGTALFAQQQGIGFTQAYGQYARETGPQQAISMQRTNLQVLQMLGIDATKIESLQDLYPYATVLSLALPQLGFTDIKSQQEAVTWAWLAIQQARKTVRLGTLPVLQKPFQVPTAALENPRLQTAEKQQLQGDIKSLQGDYAQGVNSSAYRKQYDLTMAYAKGIGVNLNFPGVDTPGSTSGNTNASTAALAQAAGTNITITLDPSAKKLVKATITPTDGSKPTNAH